MYDTRRSCEVGVAVGQYRDRLDMFSGTVRIDSFGK